MDKKNWEAFGRLREGYKKYVFDLAESVPALATAQKRLIAQRVGGVFPLDTSVVYNRSLDEVGEEDQIKLILVADNPGRREQEAGNRRYLVGPSGKLAGTFFKNHGELGIDFTKNVIILNKTPIHTPRTGDLKELLRLGGQEVARAVEDSQRAMAAFIHDFHGALRTVQGERIPLWIIGYSELGKLFAPFTRAMATLYPPGDPLREGIFLFRHFSMNQFTVDLRRQRREGESVPEALERIGSAYRQKIFGW
jgi:hypothetical protein